MNQDRSTTITNSQLKEGYKQTEVGIIPENWGISQVKGIASHTKNAIASGPFGSDLVSNDYVDNGVPIIRGQNMRMQYLSGDFAFVTNEKARSLEANLAKPRDIVFTQRGTLGQVSIVPTDSFEFYLVSQSQMKLTVNPRVADPLFFYYVFSSSEQQKYIQLNTIQTGVPHINLGILKKIPVQLPSIYEQEAIASTLSDIDALIESLDRLLIKKRQIKQGAMQDLLRSKDGWIEKNLGEVADFFKGKGLPKSAIIPFATYPCIHYGELFTKYPESILNIQSRTNINTGVFYSVANDVLMPTSDVTPNGLATASCILEDGVILGGDVLVIRIDPKKLNGSFLSYLIRYSKKQIMQLISGTTVYHLYGSDMRKFSFSMPPIEEQIEIANILSDMDAEIDSISVKLTKTRQLKQGMMHELLTGRIRLVDL